MIEQMRDDVSRPFAAEMFDRFRLPVPIASIDMGEVGALPSCLDMLVKLPGGDLTLPEPYASDPGLARIFAEMASAEDGILPAWRETRHVYLTFDRRPVEAGRTHRNAGWHFDGMQGARYPEKLPACHQYVVSSANPTEFIAAPVDATDLDEARDNWFEIVGARAAASGGEIFRPAPGEMMLMSAYQIHRSPPAETACLRTFVRIDISCKRQDRLGNTANPDLPAPWAFVPRTLPEGLRADVSDSGWSGAARFAGAKPCDRPGS